MFESLKNVVLEEIRKLEDKNTEDKYIEPKKILQEFIDLADKKDYDGIANFPIFDYFIMVIACTNTPEFTWEEITSDANLMKNKIQSWDYNKIKYFLEKLAREKIKSDDPFAIKDEESYRKLGFPQEFDKYNKKHLFSLLNSFLEYKEKILSAKKSVKNAPLAQVSKTVIPKDIFAHNQLKKYHTHPKDLPVIVTDFLSKATIYDTSRLKKVIDVFRDYNKQIKKEDYLHRYDKEKGLYNQILEQISNKKINELKDIPQEWLCLESIVITELYFVIQMNLIQEFRDVKLENNNLKKKVNRTPLTAFLFSKHINPEDIDKTIIEVLEKENIDTIKPILELIFKISININDIKLSDINTLIKTKKEDISFLQFLLNSKIVSKTTFINNVDLLTTNLTKLKTNYEILKDVVNFEHEYYNDAILLLNTQELKNRLNVLKEYNLTKNNYIYLLCNYKMLNIYDLVIENQIPVYLFVAICRTKNPINTIKRIIILKQIDEPYENNRYGLRKDVIEETRFICNDDELDKIIQNVVAYIIENQISNNQIVEENELIKQLDEQYINSKDTYIFGKTIISRPKVLRNIKNNKNPEKEELLRIIISGSILEAPSIYDIQNAIQQKKLLV